MVIIVGVVDEATLEEDGLDNDDDDTATEALDVVDVDRTMRDADGSSPMTEVDMIILRSHWWY